MSRPAANALLKTLEEPPGSTYFVLVSHAPSALARTIRSRCQAFTVPVPGREVAAAWLAEHAPEASPLLDEAEMAPFEAIRLAEEGAGVAIPKVRAAIDALLCASLDPVEAVTRLRRECDAELIVRTMLRFLQQLIRLKFGQAVPFTPDERERLSRRVKGLEFARLNALGDRITRARRDLRQSPGLNEQLMLEELAVHWSSVGHEATPAARVSPSR